MDTISNKPVVVRSRKSFAIWGLLACVLALTVTNICIYSIRARQRDHIDSEISRIESQMDDMARTIKELQKKSQSQSTSSMQ